MEVLRYEYKKMQKCSPSVLALGFFDGVTVAHRALIAAAKEKAKKSKLPLAVFTFPTENPLKKDAPRIYSTKEKLILLERCGVDTVYLADFESLSPLSPECFVNEVVIGDIDAMAAASGYNFRFGRGASGSAEDLKKLMELSGRQAIIVEELTDGGRTVSASLIRSLLEKSEIEEANRLLGSPYFLCGKVKRGLGEGKGLGFPTLNTEIPPQKCAPLGVFRSAVPIDGRIYHGVTNIGLCPTLGQRELHAETHILGYEGNLYGRECEIYLLGFLRPEQKFESREELILAVENDKKRAIKENGELICQRLGLK